MAYQKVQFLMTSRDLQGH